MYAIRSYYADYAMPQITGLDTGVFGGQFGFTNAASDGGAAPPLIRVSNSYNFV